MTAVQESVDLQSAPEITAPLTESPVETEDWNQIQSQLTASFPMLRALRDRYEVIGFTPHATDGVKVDPVRIESYYLSKRDDPASGFWKLSQGQSRMYIFSRPSADGPAVSFSEKLGKDLKCEPPTDFNRAKYYADLLGMAVSGFEAAERERLATQVQDEPRRRHLGRWFMRTPKIS